MPCGVRCDPVELADPCIPARRVDTRSVKDCCIIDTCDSSDLIRLQCGYQQGSSYRHKKCMRDLLFARAIARRLAWFLHYAFEPGVATTLARRLFSSYTAHLHLPAMILRLIRRVRPEKLVSTTRHPVKTHSLTHAPEQLSIVSLHSLQSRLTHG